LVVVNSTAFARDARGRVLRGRVAQVEALDPDAAAFAAENAPGIRLAGLKCLPRFGEGNDPRGAGLQRTGDGGPGAEQVDDDRDAPGERFRRAQFGQDIGVDRAGHVNLQSPPA
jgi:hypothetical protein